jgi:hypothetical protein
VVDGASAVAYYTDTNSALSTAGAKLWSFRNATSEKAYIGYDGTGYFGGIVLKQGANGRCGTFVATGVTPVVVANTSVAISDAIIISLNTVGGTITAQPYIATITASTGFTVICSAGDTSTWNYTIIKNAA